LLGSIPLERGGAATVAFSLLRVPTEVLLIEPTSLNKGEELVARSICGVGGKLQWEEKDGGAKRTER